VKKSPARWVDDVRDAKLYTKKGSAFAKAGVIAHENPLKPLPTVIEFTTQELVIHPLNEYFDKKQAKLIREKEARQKRDAVWKLKQAQKELAEAQEKIRKLTRDDCVHRREHRPDCGCKSCVGM